MITLRRRDTPTGSRSAATLTGGTRQQLLCDCNVYCLPSFGEPYGTTLLEAMACARAVVVTNAGGLPHMMAKNGGLCVPTGDAPALAQALLAILSSPEDQIAMGAANRAAILAEYTWAKVVDDLESVYRRLCGTDQWQRT